MAAPILAFEGLGLVQGSGWLFRNLDIYVGARDRLALIGRNGAGKTTLLKLLAGQVEADEGRRVIVPGTNVVMLEQEPRMTGCATLMDYVLSGDDAPARHEAEAIADQLGIDLTREAATASGGERRRAGIARALAQDPDVLLLDEPTRGIDVGAKYEIYQLMNQLVAEGRSIIMVSSEMPELLGVCDRILVMSNGREAGIFDAADATQVKIMEASAKYVSAGGVGV